MNLDDWSFLSRIRQLELDPGTEVFLNKCGGDWKGGGKELD